MKSGEGPPVLLERLRLRARDAPGGLARLPDAEEPDEVEAVRGESVQLRVRHVVQRRRPAQRPRELREPHARVDLEERRIAGGRHRGKDTADRRRLDVTRSLLAIPLLSVLLVPRRRPERRSRPGQDRARPLGRRGPGLGRDRRPEGARGAPRPGGPRRRVQRQRAAVRMRLRGNWRTRKTAGRVWLYRTKVERDRRGGNFGVWVHSDPEVITCSSTWRSNRHAGSGRECTIAGRQFQQVRACSATRVQLSLPQIVSSLKNPEPRNPGTQEPRNPGTQEPRNPGTQEPRSGGHWRPRWPSGWCCGC